MPNAAKRVLIAIIIDISPSTGFKNSLGSKTSIEMINEKLRNLIAQLCGSGNGKIRSCAEVCFVSYSTEVEVKPFVPLKTLESNIPFFTPVESGGTRTAAAMNAAYDAIHKRAQELSTRGGGLHTSVAILLTDGDASVHDSDDMIRKVTERVNECTLKDSRAEKTLPLVIGLGDNFADKTKKMLAGFSKGLVDDGFFRIHNSSDKQVNEDMTQVFSIIFKSILQSVGTDSVDVLLAEIRSMVQEAYGETLYHVSN